METKSVVNYTEHAKSLLELINTHPGEFNKNVAFGILRGLNSNGNKNVITAEHKKLKLYGLYKDSIYKVIFWNELLKNLITIGFVWLTKKGKFLMLSDNGIKWLKQENPQLSMGISFSKGTGENEIFNYVAIAEHDNTKEKVVKKKSYLVTYDIFKEGKTIDQISEIRRIKTITVENHLIKCLNDNLISSSDFDRLGFDMKIHDEIEKTINSEPIKGNIKKINLIKEHCPDHITYMNIKCSLSLLNKK